MDDAIAALFQRYADWFNDALHGRDAEGWRDLYEPAFVAASPGGVDAGRSDDLGAALPAGIARNREIGTLRMELLGLRPQPIDAWHALVATDWRAVYEVKGAEKPIDFTNHYLVRVTDGRARVFGWITGDEQALLRREGILS